MQIKELIEEFVSKLIDEVRAEVKAEMLEALLKGGGGRSIHTHVSASKGIGLIGKRQRRKGPIQLCPIPGCKNPAAPVFGMVCAEHKGTSKTLVKKYREARRAAKEGGGKVIPIHSAKKGKAAKAKAKKAATTKKPAKAQAA